MIQAPPNQQPFDANDRPNPMWAQFMSEVFKGLQALQSSGTTAQRPTSNLFDGRFYFDKSLGHPIWYFTSGWVDAQGNSV